MQFKNLVDVIKAVQICLKDYFGLAVEHGLSFVDANKIQSHDDPVAKANKAVCQKLGIEMTGCEFLLRTPTNQPIERFYLSWDYYLGNDEGWDSGNHQPFLHSQNQQKLKEVLTADSELNKLKVHLKGAGSHSAVEFDMADLGAVIKPRLKAEFPEVEFQIAPGGRG